jgi:phosphoserine phosphatase
LLSASINPPIDYLKERYNLKWFSSLLEEKDWEYTGNLIMWLWGEKEKVFKEKLLNIEKYAEIEFYTDNKDDISLMNYFLAQNKKLKIYVIPYNNKKYWKDYFSKSKIKYEFV